MESQPRSLPSPLKALDRAASSIANAVESGASTITSAVESGVADISRGAEGVKRGVSDLGHSAVDLAGQLVSSVQDGLETSLGALLEGVEASLRTVVDGLQRVTNEDGSETVNGYRLGPVLGRGAFGRVHKASKGGETFAVKVIQRSLLRSCGSLPAPPRHPNAPPRIGGNGASGTASGLEAVLREVAVMKQLEHPKYATVMSNSGA